jgi:hypothetical protein
MQLDFCRLCCCMQPGDGVEKPIDRLMVFAMPLESRHAIRGAGEVHHSTSPEEK